MITVKEDTTLVGVSELRSAPGRIFKEMQKRRVVIERHRKPVAVLVPIEKFREMEQLLDFVEDEPPIAVGCATRSQDDGAGQ